MGLATLSVDLVAKLATFERDLGRAARAAESSADRMARAFGVAKAGMAGLFAGLSVGVLTTAFRSVVNGVDALNDLSDATGASVEKLSSLENAAALTGTSMDTVAAALIRLNQSLSAAKPGSDAERAFKALGLSVEELKRLDPADALRKVALAFSGFADDGNKARLAQELFGKSVREVGALLKDLVEAGERNASLTNEQAAAADRFNKQLFAIQKSALDAARDIAGPLVSALNKSAEAFERIKKTDPVKIFGQELKSEITSLQLTLARAKVEDLTIGLQKSPANRGLSEALAAARADYERLSRAAADANEQLKLTLGVPAAAARRPANEGGGGLASRGRPSLPDITVPPVKTPKVSRGTLDAAGLDEATLSALRRIEQTDSAKIAELNRTLDALFAIRGSGIGGDRATDEAISAVRDELARLDPAAQAAARSAERLQAILSQTPTGRLEAVLSDIELINKEFDNGARNTEQWAEAIKVATSKLGGVAEEVQAVGTFAEQAGRNIQDALGNTLEQALTGNFKSIGEMWRNTITQMVAQAAAARLNEFIFGNTFGGSGSGPGILGDVIKAFGGMFANGGTLGAGKWGIAGEAGPEIVRGPASITPVSEVAGAGVQVVQHIVVNGDVSPATVRLVEGAMSRVKAEILRSSRTGGAFAGAY